MGVGKMNNKNQKFVKTITIPVYNRPYYLKETLLSISKNDLSGWKIFFCIEPSEYSSVAIDLINKIIHDKTDYQMIINDKKRGVEKNTYSSLQTAFNAKSKLNIYLEDDIVVAPDVTRLADWYFNQNGRGIMCLNLLHGACGGINHLSKDFPEYIIKTKHFNSCGFVLTDKQWLSYFEPYWFDYSHGFTDKNGDPMLGWDWAVFKHNLKEDRDLFVLQPMLARSNHIGRIGTFCTPKFYDNTFSNIRISNYSNEINYRIITENDMGALL